MKYLFVGSFDMAGRAIATRMYREGGQVAWLTPEPTCDLWEDKVHGRTFRHEITPHLCSQILEGETTDCVVILTAPWRERTDRGSQAYGTLLGMLGSILTSAAAARVGKICLLSSEQLAQDDLLSPGLEELRAAERMATSFCTQHDLDLLILRAGLLFSRHGEQASLIGQLFDDIRAGRPARCPYTADSELDLLCASDLADAFLRLFNLKATGTHTVLTGSPTTARTLCDTVVRIAGHVNEVSYGTVDYACDESRADAVRLLSGWMPFYPFASKGERFLREGYAEDTAPKDAPAKIAWKELPKTHPLAWETFQNLVLFAVACLLASVAEEWSDLRYVDVRLLYVIIVAICFGMRQGLIATALACLSYAWSLLHSGIDVSYLFYSVSTWVPFIIYGVAGAFGGYWSDKRHDEYDTLMRESDELYQRYDLLKGLYREVVGLKNRLQKQIVVSKDSFSRMYSIVSELDSTDPRTLLARTVRVIEQAMDSDGAAIYLLAGEGERWARLAVCSSAWSGRLSPTLDLTDLPALYGQIHESKVFANTALDERYPSFAMPVMRDGEPEALVAVYGMDMEHFTADYENRFQTLVQMIQDSLVRAFAYERENWEKFYLPGTRIYNANAFAREMETLRSIDETYGCPYSRARLSCTDGATDPLSVYQRAEPLLRNTDLIGIGEDGSVQAAFLYVDVLGRIQLKMRLAARGLAVLWED